MKAYTTLSKAGLFSLHQGLLLFNTELSSVISIHLQSSILMVDKAELTIAELTIDGPL